MKWLKKRFQKVWIPVGVVLSLVLTSFSGISFVQPGHVEAEETEEVNKELANPRIEKDSSMEAGQKVTWDCVWFGSYPQAEVVPASEEYTALPEEFLQEGDLIQDDELYQILQSATGWDEQGDIVIGDEKYRRITKENATNITFSSGFYKWESETEYHYFKYQPIKWRVLFVNDSEAFLLADKVLDDKQYHIKIEDVTWEGSTIRSWLNGYNASANIQNQDYSSDNFIDTAFGISGQQAIKETYVENKESLKYRTDGGNDTQDKVFLLSESETYTDAANGYGFFGSRNNRDEARMAGSSVYAKSMGTYSNTLASYVGNCNWWLRSPGSSSNYAARVDYDGWVNRYSSSDYVYYDICGVRPALNLNLIASSNLWSYAGTVCSDEIVNGIKPENTPEASPSAEPTNTPEASSSAEPTNTPEASPSSKPQDVTEVDKKLSNPFIEKDSSMKAEKKVTWDCVWFGSYPQAEVVPANNEYTALLEELLKEGDLIQDDALYQTLQLATGWDEQGDIVVNGEKYRRITKKDASLSLNNYNSHYNWKSETEYHYFKYQPIKWRVLSANDYEAFLLADKVLDAKQYHTTDDYNAAWRRTIIRSWLNGYNASSNTQNQDYSNKNFINNAFGIYGQQAIKEIFVENNTQDKIFLLSYKDIVNDTYGFSSSRDVMDGARMAISSVYAKAMGTSSYNNVGNCCWWLESPGVMRNMTVEYEGDLYNYGRSVGCRDIGVRPVLNLNLTASSDVASSNLWFYAGTVCSDGTVDEIKPVSTPEASPSAEPESTPEANPSSKPQDVTEVGKKLSNPRVVPDSSMGAGQKVTWDCVWFGSYPQAEVVPADSEYTALPEMYLKKEDDLIQDDVLYQTLQSATGWDEQGDIVVNGEKYRRITKEDANCTDLFDKGVGRYYNWGSETKYHYFKYQPIKWRILSVNGTEAFLLADKALDDKPYHTKRENVKWEGSTIRSWLNGYNASANIQNQDYSSENFIDTAFGIYEQKAIKETYVENKASLKHDTHGGNNTYDKVFLLSESEIYTDVAKGYGFASEDKYDEARKAGSSVYGKAMGICTGYSEKYCFWWLRSPGHYNSDAVYQYTYYHYTAVSDYCGVRPALNINLTALPEAISSNLWSYAGTVCSDGTVYDITEAGKRLSNPHIVPDSSMEAGQKVTWDCVWFGSYPQAEVVPANSQYTTLPENLLQEGDLIQDDALYQTLQSATGWNKQGDIMVNGEKYRRINSKDNTVVPISIYKWKNRTEYHYFKYQPIKWRVLSVNGTEAFLLADKVLDGKQYHTKNKGVMWEGSTIRSWLNGYNASANIQNQNYSSKNFIDTAFGIYEQKSIKETFVKDDYNYIIKYGIDGRNSTQDKIFLLSKSETCVKRYGFVYRNYTMDEARRAGSSVYAKAIGIRSLGYGGKYVGKCNWWLRSPGNISSNALSVNDSGWFYDNGYDVDYRYYGVRPALNLNLNKYPDVAYSNLWSYAGTVCSDGTMNEIKPESTPEVSPSPEPENTPTPLTPFIPYNVPSGGGSVNVTTQTPDPTVLPTVSPKPTVVPVVPQTPKPAETESALVPETGNNPSQTNVPGSTAKPDEETGNNSNIDNSDIDNSNTDNTNNSGNIKISKGSMVTDKKTKAVYKVIKNGKKNTVQYINNTKKNTSSVTIPNKIKINGKSYKVDSIGKGAFKNNKKLKKVKIGKNIKTIGKGAFAGCKNLTDVEIGENVTEIKENAFSKCTSLVMVTIPAKVNKIGNRAFYKCKNLQYILVKSNKLMESNIGKEVFSGGFSTPRIKTDKSKWELYQKIFTARGMSQKALYIIDPVKLIP